MDDARTTRLSDPPCTIDYEYVGMVYAYGRVRTRRMYMYLVPTYGHRLDLPTRLSRSFGIKLVRILHVRGYVLVHARVYLFVGRVASRRNVLVLYSGASKRKTAKSVVPASHALRVKSCPCRMAASRLTPRTPVYIRKLETFRRSGARDAISVDRVLRFARPDRRQFVATSCGAN